MAGEDQEKTEEATQAKREEFRRRGQVAQSRELAGALFVVLSAMAIFILGRFFFSELEELFHYSFGQDMVAAVRGGDMFTALKLGGQKALILTLPVVGVTFLIGIGATVIQVGFLQVEDALAPKFEKLNPVEGLKRIFSLRSVVEALKAILKMILIGAIVIYVIKSEVIRVPFLIQYSVEQLVHYIGTVTMKMLAGIGLALTVLAIADYFFQRWDTEKKMMMSKQEVKEEHKNREGDPMIKARIRRVQREMANKRMMEKVPTADVIITNPTHIAVALKYDEGLPAPQLIAKGADLIAEKIKTIARENNIPVIENKPLARTIFKTMKLGQVIPRELFVAVAEVLSYVYKLRKKMKSRVVN